jgi:hypothetical protein
MRIGVPGMAIGAGSGRWAFASAFEGVDDGAFGDVAAAAAVADAVGADSVVDEWVGAAVGLGRATTAAT